MANRPPIAPRSPVFLEKSSYRQRRLRDAARLLPLLGVILWLLPLSWGELDAASGEASGALIYIFGVWVVLIVLAAAFARHFQGGPDPARDEAD